MNCYLTFPFVTLILLAVFNVEAQDALAGPEGQAVPMAVLAPPPRLSDRKPGAQTVPCLPEVSLSLGVNLTAGKDYTCGVLTVPQNWDAPDGRNLDISYVVIRATGGNPLPDPLIFLAGGPGSSGILNTDIRMFQDLHARRDIILYDIRGAGLSQRTGFAECLVLAMQNGVTDEKIKALWEPNDQLWAATHIGEPALETLKNSEVDHPVLNEICWEQFSGQGLDMNRFSTASNARDAVELVKALGYESFNIYSASYGTRLAMTIMDVLPEFEGAPELRSVVLDSTFPPSVYLVRTLVRSHHDYMVQLLEECQSDTACNAAYPNLKQRLSGLLNRLGGKPIKANGETVTLENFIDQLTNTGNSRAAFIPKMIAEAERGMLDTYLALRDGKAGANPVETIVPVELDKSDPVQAFISDSFDLLSDDAAIMFIVYANMILVQEDPVTVFHSFIVESYAGEIGDKMLKMLGDLNSGDFANSPYASQQRAIAAVAADPELIPVKRRKGIISGMPRPLYSSIHCIDDIRHERFEDAVNSYNDLLFPQLTDLVESKGQANRCVNWPVTAAPIEVKDPVSSDVPAIILQGSFDRSTPVYMGRRASRELENSTFILVPQKGHGTWSAGKSDCVGQIATAFVQNPRAEPDLSCLETRKPQWVLPDR